MTTPSISICNDCGNTFYVETLGPDGICIHCKAPITRARRTRETIPGQPNAWIQWKGTNVCMDVHCECGTMYHVDSDFTYFLHCPNCNSYFIVGAHIQLIKAISETEINEIKSNPCLHELQLDDDDD